MGSGTTRVHRLGTTVVGFALLRQVEDAVRAGAGGSVWDNRV